MVVFGTRPEAIKMCPLVKELQKRNGVDTVVCVTGQHREMLNQVLDVFEIIPKYDLRIMQEHQDLFDITTNILKTIKSILKDEKPDLVLVHGDTTTTFVVALASFYLQIPVGHVEAGLRTFNINSPFPEEYNRQAVGLIAKYHFAPTQRSACNLISEGKQKESIFITGNTAIDALKTTIKKDFHHDLLSWAGKSRLVLLTAHRRENLGKPLCQVFRAVRRILEEFDDVKIVYPIHMNPIIRTTADRFLGSHDRIKIIEPLDVIVFHNILARVYLVLTDSGGIQEEAPSLGKPVLVLRDTTERPEGLEAGTLRLVGTSEEEVYKNFKELLTNKQAYQRMSQASNPYGDGNASTRIVDLICDYSHRDLRVNE
jgi:UDP-N-acetylglucosamine 2-epimerase (non-hydrolysing)